MMAIPLPTVQRLIRVLMTLPGVGPRTAQRLAMHVLQLPPLEVQRLVEAIQEARASVRLCAQCFSMTEDEVCAVCRDPQRATGVLCVVEAPLNVWAIERTGVFRGHYHVLMGVLSPLHGVGPEQLKIRELMERLRSGRYQEVVLALNPTVEGEATCTYLAAQIKPLGIRITRLAAGLPMGADIEYVDELTLTRALQGRLDL
ncbi:Recombination protein RecR [bacterium HR11]|nr:Recombination protein RecR [bacterium HR11]